MDKDTICAYPWILLSVGSIGNLRPCCNAINARIEEPVGEMSMITRKKDFTLDSLLNNHTHKELRKSMLDGERNSICDRCWKMEDSGMESFREAMNRRFSDAVDKIRKTKSVEPIGIQKIEFDLGMKCNLRCRMCAPWSSSLIHKETRSQPESYEYYGGFNPLENDWVDVIDMKKLLEPHLETLREIYLIGGEPLIIDAHEELLDYLVDSGVSSKITLLYNTNGITLKTKFIEQWKKFRFVQLNVSIDGIYEYYDYIRNPAKWGTIDKNIDILIRETKNSNVNVGISSTLQNLTVPAMLSLFIWAESKRIKVQVHPVDHPEFLQPNVMPEADHAFYLTELKQYVDKLEINDWSLKQTISYMEGNTNNLTNYELQRKFLNKQLLLDKIRNQDIFSTHPWVKNIK